MSTSEAPDWLVELITSQQRLMSSSAKSIADQVWHEIHQRGVTSDELVEVILDYGGIDGAHHKQWILDQLLRRMLGSQYEAKIEEWQSGEDGPETYLWDEGIAP
jgi:hypothetical protein